MQKPSQAPSCNTTDGDAREVGSGRTTASISPAPQRRLPGLRSPGVLRALGSADLTDDGGLNAARLEAVASLTPVAVSASVVNACVVTAALWSTAPKPALLLWLVTILAISAARALSATRRPSAQHSRRLSRRLRRVTLLGAGLGALWALPSVLWFEDATVVQRFAIGCVVAGMMCGGSLSLAALPIAALGFVLALALGAAVMMLELGSPALLVLLAVYTACLCTAVVTNGRRFADHHRTGAELAEAGRMLDLLREFDSSGSGWLWELDENLAVNRLSREMAGALGCDVDELLGTDLRKLLCLTDDRGPPTSGLRALADHLAAQRPFKDLAVPIVVAGETRWWSLSAKPLRDERGRFLGYRGVGSDITLVRLEGDHAVSLARRDALTGLPNRLLVKELVEEALMPPVESGGCALLMIDLDRFKAVNDTLGHAVGDKLLVAVARRLQACLDGSATAGRLGGDEFAIVCPGGPQPKQLSALATRVIAKLSEPYRIEDFQIVIGASVGIARAPDHGLDENEITRAADLALYRAKSGGRGSYAYYEPQMFEEAEARRRIELDLREALADGRMSLLYQPIVAAGSREVVAFEALLRWTDPDRGDVPPAVFIPIAEETGLINQLGDWVLRQACAEAASWSRDLKIAVNISTAQIAKGELATSVLSALAATGLPAKRLELEVTESIFLSDSEQTRSLFHQLSTLGVHLALDDFGRGYCSFGYLGRGNFSKIKVDQSFVRAAAGGCRDSRAIIEAMIELARKLELEITAEGVETAQQAALMEALGCTQLQGFFFGRPGQVEGCEPTEDAVSGQALVDLRQVRASKQAAADRSSPRAARTWPQHERG